MFTTSLTLAGCGGPPENTVKPPPEQADREDIQQHYQEASKPQR
ncbi:hypothetical protein [Rhodopirellula bahusiensis]